MEEYVHSAAKWFINHLDKTHPKIKGSGPDINKMKRVTVMGVHNTDQIYIKHENKAPWVSGKFRFMKDTANLYNLFNLLRHPKYRDREVFYTFGVQTNGREFVYNEIDFFNYLAQFYNKDDHRTGEIHELISSVNELMHSEAYHEKILKDEARLMVAIKKFGGYDKMPKGIYELVQEANLAIYKAEKFVYHPELGNLVNVAVDKAVVAAVLAVV